MVYRPPSPTTATATATYHVQSSLMTRDFYSSRLLTLKLDFGPISCAYPLYLRDLYVRAIAKIRGRANVPLMTDKISIAIATAGMLAALAALALLLWSMGH
jgi:hypothetical protein